MSIEPDDLHSHRNLGADLMKMENEKQRLALFDELVAALQELYDKEKLDDDHPALAHARNRAYNALHNARALQK